MLDSITAAMNGQPPPARMFYSRARGGTAQHAEERQAFVHAFGLGLTLERVKRGLTQDEFADLIGVHRTFAGQLERGQRGINIRELPRIARALDMEPADLIPQLDDQHEPPATQEQATDRRCRTPLDERQIGST